MSRHIELEKLNNTRDLGGMPVKDGRKIKDGLLIRSGHLFFANEHDKETISGLVDIIVDFRTSQEIFEKPDPYIEGIDYHHIPIISSWVAGITWEEKTGVSEQEVFAKLQKEPNLADEYMRGIYRGFATNEFYLGQYNSFVNLLINNYGKKILWHCTAGKDRAGFASVIVEELLEVPRDVIIEDYMKTNEYLKEEIVEITERVKEKFGEDEVSEQALKLLFGAEMDFIESTYKAIDEMYGSFDNYIYDGLKISKYDRIFMQDMYLE